MSEGPVEVLHVWSSGVLTVQLSPLTAGLVQDSYLTSYTCEDSSVTVQLSPLTAGLVQDSYLTSYNCEDSSVTVQLSPLTAGLIL